ncbi:threonine synthase [Clostridium gasigenes]|uniref:threonine synthase n=1 Tax=Clostridium gasigenes TaxID=94869 RepID=UPI001C0CA0AC|nr:threonine synthase [Clostridium gasigenes]MBU3132114.1 threonine synthase [Clostridium gasigenes]
MRFISTRGAEKDILSARAIINGIASDGGLYVPEKFPRIYEKIKNRTNICYEDLANEIISKFFTDIKKEDLKKAIDEAYKGKFEVKEEKNFLELYHGPTSAFKDAALLFLPQIMKRAKNICSVKEEIVILTATSGDTGKAALEGFKNVEGFKVVVYYPEKGVSEVQKQQMVTQEGKNLKVIGINGNFDNAQTGVKKILGDKNFREQLKDKGHIISSANSINIGRLIAQIVYYFYGYLQLVNKQKIKEGDKINVVVPTGNFGNILAAYYAREMGLPIAKFICASNENKVLTDFFKTSVYDKRRELKLTESPSMDILVSSNLERLLFEASNRNCDEVKNLMDSLNNDGIYTVKENYKEFLKDFYGEYATKDEVYTAIRSVYEVEGYLMDTHTAVAYVVNQKYVKETDDNTQYLLVSTASPYKFPRSICTALGLDVAQINDFEVLNKLKEYTGVNIPTNLQKLDEKPILHNEVWDSGNMKEALLSYLKGNNNDKG